MWGLYLFEDVLASQGLIRDRNVVADVVLMIVTYHKGWLILIVCRLMQIVHFSKVM